MSGLIVIGFMLLALFGLPIAFAMGAAALAALAYSGIDFSMVPQRMMHAVNSFPLMSIPFFMLAGELMIKAGIVERLIALANTIVGRVRGGGFGRHSRARHPDYTCRHQTASSYLTRCNYI